MSNKRLMEVFADVEVDTDQLEAFIKGQVSTDILLPALNSDYVQKFHLKILRLFKTILSSINILESFADFVIRFLNSKKDDLHLSIPQIWG